MAYLIQTNEMGTWQNVKVPFIVPTPKAYIVDLTDLYEQGMQFPFADVEKETEKREELLGKVQKLRSIMARLDIGELEGYELDLTLNIHTREYLRRRAWEQGQDDVASELMGNDW